MVGTLVAGPQALSAQEEFPLTASESAQTHFWAGVDDALNIFPRRAAHHYEMALEADPGFGLAKVFHSWQAPGLTGAQRQEGIQQGIAMMGDATSTELALAAAIKDLQGGEAAAGSRALLGLSERYPDDPRVAMWATNTANARGDQTDAAARMTDLNTRYPDFPPPYNLLAYTLWPRGNRAGAMQAVRTYAELLPDHPNPHDSYAELLQWDGQYEAALRHYARATELAEGFDQGYVGAAEVYWLMGDRDAALRQLQMAEDHAITPAAAVTYRRAMGHVYLMSGDEDRGMEYLARAAELGEAEGVAPGAALALEEMAVADAMMGSGDQVAAHLARAAELRGSEPPIHQGMAAIAHAYGGDVDATRAAARDIMENNQGAFWQNFGHTLMGVADMMAEDYEAALRHLSMADPGNQMNQAAMATVLEELDRDVEARSKWNEIETTRQINLANIFLAMAMMEQHR
jgi:tetratricopeptide (TPR) repeat protein